MHWLAEKTVVIPVDFSEDSFRALSTASAMAHETTILKVLHVLPILEPAEPGIMWHTIDDDSRRQHVVKALHEELAKRGFGTMIVDVRFGDPGHEIAEYAEEGGAALIVVSSHGRSSWQRLLIGSVADRVVRLARCPVLLMRC